jgi:phosphoadenosine phosphosulfate reductase
VDPLEKKVLLSQLIIKRAIRSYGYKKVFVSWSGGKDSTVVLHIIKKMFNNQIPFNVLFRDSTKEPPEIYDFIKKISHLWHINLLLLKYDKKAINACFRIKDKTKKVSILKNLLHRNMQKVINKHQFKAIIEGVRLDEPHNKSDKFFERKHNIVFFQPILHFGKRDIWDYIHLHNLPYASLYNQDTNR